jgi:group I intron endonuclease
LKEIEGLDSLNPQPYGIIYKATSPSGKVYVGQTTQGIEVRKTKHHYSANFTKTNTIFNKAIKKYGIEGFVWEIIDTADNQNELNEKEIFWIAFYDSTNSVKGYNQRLGGYRGKANRELCEKLSEIKRGHPVSWETRQKISGIQKGLKRSEEFKKKVSLGSMGRIVTPETRKKISKAKKGQHHTEETRRKISESHKGKPNLQLRGKHPSPEARKRMSEAHKGYKLSDETKKKIGLAGRGKTTPLTQSDVIEIKRRLAAGEKLKSLSADFNVSICCISSIKRGRSWSWLEAVA